MYRFAPILALLVVVLLIALHRFPPVVQEVALILLLTACAFLIARMIDAAPPSSLSPLPLLVLAAFAATVWIVTTATTAQRLMEPAGGQVGTAEMILRRMRHFALWAYVTMIVVKVLRGEYRGYRARKRRRG